MSHHDYSSKKPIHQDGFSQTRNQLGAPGGAKSFLRGPSFFNYVQ